MIERMLAYWDLAWPDLVGWGAFAIIILVTVAGIALGFGLLYFKRTARKEANL